MNRFKNILFVADQPGAESPVFERALELATVNRAALTVMDVVEPMIWSAENQARFGADLTNILRDRRLDELATMTGPRQVTELPIRTDVAIGTPFLEIIRATLKHGFDLVIKGAERPQSLRRRILGPNDQHLLRKCPCPVWIDRADRPRPYRKILAAVDPLEQTGLELGRTIIELATSFTAWEGSEVHVAHAWHLPGESTLEAGRVRIPRPKLEQLLADQEHLHTQALGDLLTPYGMTPADPNVHFAKGMPAALIADLANELPADLIVLGTVGRTGIPGFFIGNTAESVMQMAELPVLTVKPRGFRSPVEG